MELKEIIGSAIGDTTPKAPDFRYLMEPVTITILIASIASGIAVIIDAFRGDTAEKKNLGDKLSDLALIISGVVKNLWGTGGVYDPKKPPEPDKDKKKCYIATKTYSSQEKYLKPFYVFKNSLPGKVIKGYYVISPYLVKKVPKIVFLPVVEGLRVLG